MGVTHGLPQPLVSGGGRRVIALVMALLVFSACVPSNQKEEELRKEIQALKAQVAGDLCITREGRL